MGWVSPGTGNQRPSIKQHTRRLVCQAHLGQRQVVADKGAPPQHLALRQQPAQQRVRRVAVAGGEQRAERRA